MELEKKYIDLITKKFPAVSFTNTTLITKGWDNDVVLLDNNYVFRFPKRENSKNRFPAEVKLLKYLATDSPLPIPAYNLISTEPAFGGYTIIDGKEMEPGLVKELDRNTQELIAKQLGDFLAFLHSTPLTVAHDAGFQEEPNGYWWGEKRTSERYERLQKLVFPNLTQKEVIWTTHQFETYLDLDFSFKRTVTHSDIKSDHIFFKDNKISGIIDFAEVEIGDPALDFAGIWSYGEEFLIKVLNYYNHTKTDDYLQRSQFPNLVRNLGNMLKIAEGRTLPQTYETFYKKQRNIIDSGASI